MIQIPMQDEKSNNPQLLLEQFKIMKSGHGPKRLQREPNKTRRAQVQINGGLIAACKHLFLVGFDYVLFCELQSKRIEGEFILRTILY